MSNPSLDRWTEFGVDCHFVKQSASISLVPTWTSFTSGRTLHCSKKNAFNSICLTSRVEPLRLIIPSLQKTHNTRSFFNNQFHCCRKLMPSQAPESAATNSASPLLRAIVDCFLLDAVIGYQPSLPRNHDAVPLTLIWSASPAQSESPYVNTKPTGALLTAAGWSVVGPHCHDSTEVLQD